MNDNQYSQVKGVIKDKLNNIRRMLTSATDKYDIDESIDKNTLVDTVSDVILEIQDIKEFMDKLPTVAELAIGDACTGSNPRIPTQEEMEKLLKACYYGEDVDF